MTWLWDDVFHFSGDGSDQRAGCEGHIRGKKSVTTGE